MGELIEETDIKGNTTRFEYNALGRITSVIDSVGRTTKYYYSYGGRMEKTVYPNNRQVLYEYDRLGRLKKRQIRQDLVSHIFMIVWDEYCPLRVVRGRRNYIVMISWATLHL